MQDNSCKYLKIIEKTLKETWNKHLWPNTRQRLKMQFILLSFQTIQKWHNLLMWMGNINLTSCLHQKNVQFFICTLFIKGCCHNLGNQFTFGVKAHYNDLPCDVTSYHFSKRSFLNLNHVKTTKDFHNGFV